MNKQQSLYEFGQNFLGPICSEYFFHISDYCRDNNIDYIGFLAREGYLFNRIYSRLVENKLLEKLPSGYINVSRTFLFRLGISNIFSLKHSLSHSFSGTFSQLLVMRYGFTLSQVEACFSPEELNSLIELPENQNDVQELLLSHSIELDKLLESTRTVYQDYLATTGVTQAKKPLFLDVGYSGTIQKLLSDFLGKDVHGLYFIATNPGEYNILNNNVTMKGVFKENVKMGGGYLMLDRSLFLEGLLTAPVGQFIDINKYANSPSYDFTFARKAYVQNNFHELNEVFNGAIDFVVQAFTHNVRYSNEEIELIFEQYATRRNLLPRATWPMFDVDDAISGNPNINPLTFFGL